MEKERGEEPDPRYEMMEKKKWLSGRFWIWAIASVFFRLIFICFPRNLNLSSRPELSTPITSLRRLAEGYWLKQSSMSPYAGSMYHGSPLLLSVLGPLTVDSLIQVAFALSSFDLLYLWFAGLKDNQIIFCADIVGAMLIRATGQQLQMSFRQNLKLLGLLKSSTFPDVSPCGDIAALVYLWNPFTILSCVGLSTSPVENLAVILSIYGATNRKVPLAAFGWVLATHMSLYPAILIIPILFLLGYGLDVPPQKLFLQRRNGKNGDDSAPGVGSEQLDLNQKKLANFSWATVMHFVIWALVWSIYVLILCGISLKGYGGLGEMFKSTYGFILKIEDLSPNIGVFWYFFAEVFDFFRSFFLIVFHVNILFLLLPLAIRLRHRPCFLAFVYIAISSILKSYPSVGDSALYLSIWALFVNELADMKLSFFLFCGYAGVSLLSPVMHNLWIWRGTGNANFYFGTAIAYACFQIFFVVESVSAMLNHDRKLRKQTNLKAS